MPHMRVKVNGIDRIFQFKILKFSILELEILLTFYIQNNLELI